MATSAILPTYSQPVVDSQGRATPAFYRFFSALGASSGNTSDLQVQIDAINQEIAGIGEGFQVRAQNSIVQSGASVPGGVVMFSLSGDVSTAGNTQYYGSDQAGNKGWHAVSSALAVTSNLSLSTDATGVSTFDLADLADSGAGSLLAITRDGKGRITGTRAATITGTASRITVTNGNASAGFPTIDLDQSVQDLLSLFSAIAPDLRDTDAGAYRVTDSGAYRSTQ